MKINIRLVPHLEYISQLLVKINYKPKQYALMIPFQNN